MIAPARRAAYEVVRRVFEGGAYADRALASAAAGLDARDRALAQRIAYGAVQRRRTIDHGIDELGRRPVRKLDPPVIAALRIAGYELAWSGAPAHAVADDAVELVRAAGLERATAFTNAVVRRLAEGFPQLVESLPEGPLKLSYPDWIFELWERDWGFDEAAELARAQNEPGELVVRAAEPVGEPTDVPGAYRVERVDPADVAAGRVWPQSRGSQLAALALGSRDGERVLDACAAPGGKATMLRGSVTAVEVHEGRARELEENVRRLGATNVRVVRADVRELDESGFDRALVDAPCSGLGVLGRRPDLRWRARALPELELELLRAAAERTRPGGTVVYSVCTLNADENEAVVDASGLEPEPLGEEWPQFAHPKRPEFLLTTPHRHGTSGFFIARLKDRRMSLARALQLAAAAAGRAYPKPTVGAVVVRDGEVVGEGVTEAGGRHGEAVALDEAGDRAGGATLFATMEPCDHWGTQPPCTERILAAGVARVVAGCRDPNPEAAGGLERLEAAGVDVELLDSFEARAQNEAWRVWVSRGRPFVTYKVAATLDGRVTVPGERWVSGEAARRLVHELRAASDAVAVGMGTVRADAPRLDARDVPTPRGQPRRLAFGRGPLPDGSELELRSGPLADELAALAGEGVQSLLLEGGPTLASAFLEAELVDKLIVFVAPTLAGTGPGPLAAAIRSPRRLFHLSTRAVGDDVLLQAYVHEL